MIYFVTLITNRLKTLSRFYSKNLKLNFCCVYINAYFNIGKCINFRAQMMTLEMETISVSNNVIKYFHLKKMPNPYLFIVIKNYN